MSSTVFLFFLATIVFLNRSSTRLKVHPEVTLELPSLSNSTLSEINSFPRHWYHSSDTHFPVFFSWFGFKRKCCFSHALSGSLKTHNRHLLLRATMFWPAKFRAGNSARSTLATRPAYFEKIRRCLLPLLIFRVCYSHWSKTLHKRVFVHFSSDCTHWKIK